MTKKTILVPIDFSKASIKALEVAVKLAKKIDAQLLILNVCKERINLSNSDGNIDSHNLTKEAELNAHKKFEAMKESIIALDEIDHEFIVRHAFPQDAIISMTLMYFIDLIIIGTKGPRKSNGILEGSNTYVIAKNVKCPVLAIPEGADTSNLFRNIGLAGDYKKTAPKETFEILTQIAMAYGSDIHVVHVSQSPEITQQEINEAKKLDRYFKDLYHNFTYKIDTELDEGLNEHIQEKHIDLLALVKKRKESVDHIFNCTNTEKYTNLCKIPFLILNST
jgi:nucleotide-binding universal stress UspA family protein